MATDVFMPALGMAQETGKVLRWHKAVGDLVRQGEVLVEIETDKTTVELEAPASGLLGKIEAAEGMEVPVGHRIALIGTTEEVGAASQAPAPVVAVVAPVVAEPAQVVVTPAPAFTVSPNPAGVAGRILSSPLARRLAQEQGIDLAQITGSGPDGAVVAADLKQAVPSPISVPVAAIPAAVVATAAAAAPAPVPTADFLPMTAIDRIMAERTAQSWTTAPHFFLTREANAGRLIAWRDRVRNRLGVSVTYTDLLVRVVADALRQHALLNGRWHQGGVMRNDAINIGLAVAGEQGLVVPVIHGAEALTIEQIARRRFELVARAQSGRLLPQDLQGGTFTISNLGMYGIDSFQAILNGGQAAILAVGAIVEKVVPVDGRPAVQSRINLTLTCDHRVVDGARGAQFLKRLVESTEEPLDLLG